MTDSDDMHSDDIHEVPDTGIDLVRRVLEEARLVARSQGKEVGRGGRSSRRGRSATSRRGRRGWSGPGPDWRDPQLLTPATQDVIQSRGWSSRVAETTVFTRWLTIVGADIAEHAQPTALSEGVLSVAAESTAWATQLRMVQAQLLAKIIAAAGEGVVTTLKITGPVAPSWRKGPLHISGRGPRDTYG